MDLCELTEFVSKILYKFLQQTSELTQIHMYFTLIEMSSEAKFFLGQYLAAKPPIMTSTVGMEKGEVVGHSHVTEIMSYY